MTTTINFAGQELTLTKEQAWLLAGIIEDAYPTRKALGYDSESLVQLQNMYCELTDFAKK